MRKKQKMIEMVIEQHYEDDFITEDYAEEISKIMGIKVTTDDIYDALDNSRYPSHNGWQSDDYSVSKMAKELLKRI